MKKSILCSVLLFLSFFISTAQQQPKNEKNDNGREKIKALYVAYITQELSLNESEAQKFWPVHEQFDAELKALNKQKDLSELEREEGQLNVRKKYSEKFEKIIGKERTNNFYRKDKEFRNKMIFQVQKHKMKNGDHGKKPKPEN